MSRPVLGVQSDQTSTAVSLADVPSEGGGAQVDSVAHPGHRARAAEDVFKQSTTLRLSLKSRQSLGALQVTWRGHTYFSLIFLSLLDMAEVLYIPFS